jgi:hypothetical protein
VFYVPPQVVLEIAFDQIQKSARHASGYALRFPRIKRIRWDKNPVPNRPPSRRCLMGCEGVVRRTCNESDRLSPASHSGDSARTTRPSR